MKYAHIGLVALATMVIAGCGGGSDNSGGGGSFDVTLPAAARSALVEFEGETYQVAAGKSLSVDVDGGQITFSGCADGCSVTVSRSNGRVVVKSTVKDVSARFTPTQTTTQSPTQQRPTQPPNTVTREEAEELAEDEFNRGVRQGEQTANLRQRAENSRAILNPATLPTAGYVVNVIDNRNQDRTVRASSLGSVSFSGPDVSIVGSDWSRSTFSGLDQTVHLYTNIASHDTSASSRAFWKVHRDAVDSDPGIQVLMGSGSSKENDPVFGDYTLESVATASSPIPLKSDGTRAAGPKGSGESRVAGEGFESLTMRGSLGGVPGTFRCSSGCEGTVGDDDNGVEADIEITSGKPDFKAGTWHFTPSNSRSNYHRPQDETYLYFGFWAQHPEEPDAARRRFQGIADGAFDNNDGEFTYSDLTGSATFEGGAVGQYAIVDRIPEMGEFAAKVTLSANFAGGDNENKVSGSITDFRVGESSKASDPSDPKVWRLDLVGTLTDGVFASDADISGGAVGGTADSARVTGKIDGVGVTGNWAAALYGVDNEAKPDGVSCPSHGCGADLAGFAGRFKAGEGEIVAISGAFAAPPK